MSLILFLRYALKNGRYEVGKIWGALEANKDGMPVDGQAFKQCKKCTIISS